MTVPLAGITSSMSTLVSVVLPAPLRPTSPIRSPALMWNVTSDSSVRAPTTTDNCCAEIIAVLPHEHTYGVEDLSHCRETTPGFTILFTDRCRRRVSCQLRRGIAVLD